MVARFRRHAVSADPAARAITAGMFRWRYLVYTSPGIRLTFYAQRWLPPVLRVAHLRDWAYEAQQHARLARRAGLTGADLARIGEGPDAPGWQPRQRAILAELARQLTA